jgi:hypothetical protein
MPKLLVGTNDLLTVNPVLSGEWHPTRNGAFVPSDVTAGSNKRAWWLCREGHEWEATVNHRSRGRGCPYCSGNTVTPGVNDLAASFPQVAKEWHPTKNGEKTPEMIAKGSHYRAEWICSKGHEWSARVYSRVAGSGCPVCAGQVVLAGLNDLETTHTGVAAEWHPTKNSHIRPSDVSAGSNARIWWSCDLDHEWIATPNSRTGRNTGCPVCAGLRVEPGFNDLSTTHPKVAAEWHPLLNEGAHPTQVMAGSDKKFWWRCESGHEWRASISNRAKGSGCPVCSGQRVVTGMNDLQTEHPELAREWHPSKNETLTPLQVLPGTHRRIWWQCGLGHEWQAAGSTRLSGRGCPVCSGRVAWPGYNDMATTHPHLVTDWHPTKNGGLKPENLTAGSGTLVWWKCPSGHEWRTMANNRARGSGCPSCANYGFDAASPAYLYFLRSHEFRARKIGIANEGSTRIVQFVTGGWELVHRHSHDSGLVVADVESALLRWIRKDLSLPPTLTRRDMRRTGGWTETFSIHGPSDELIIQKIEDVFGRKSARSSSPDLED